MAETLPSSEAPFTPTGLDALPPAGVARKAEAVGVTKAGMPALDVFVLAVLAGAFIGLGAAFATTVGSGAGGAPYGMTRLLVGLAFTLGLILVVVAGAELFTGNNLIVMAWASRSVEQRPARPQLDDRLRGELRRRIRDSAARLPGTAVHVRRRRGRRHGAHHRVDEDEPRLRPGHRPRRTVQRPRLPRRMADLRCAHDHGQDPRRHPSDRSVRRTRLRALGREHVLHPDRAAHQDRTMRG